MLKPISQVYLTAIDAYLRFECGIYIPNLLYQFIDLLWKSLLFRDDQMSKNYPDHNLMHLYVDLR